MRCYLYICICCIITSISSCNNKPKDKINDLLELDRIVQNHVSLHAFTSFDVSQNEINGVAVCDSMRSKCRLEEIHYDVILKQIGVPVDNFNMLVNKLSAIGFKKYYRYGSYSVWVENGALGDIYGYLINHGSSTTKVKSFELDGIYHIGIGKKIRENVYYFSSNLD